MTDERQFELIYNEHKKLVYNLCLHYTLHAEDARDITQEVFVKLYQRYHLFDPTRASLTTWITRIAINQCLDFIKSKNTRKRFGFFSSLFHPSSGEPIPGALDLHHPGIAAEDKESVGRLLHIIRDLPANQKTAIILNKIENRSQKEVAEIMDTTVKAVESLIQRAKITIQKKLDSSEG